MLFIETSIFTKQIKELVSDEEYRQLQQDLNRTGFIGDFFI